MQDFSRKAGPELSYLPTLFIGDLWTGCPLLDPWNDPVRQKVEDRVMHVYMLTDHLPWLRGLRNKSYLTATEKPY